MAQWPPNVASTPPVWIALVDDEVEITQALQTLLGFSGIQASVHHSAESLLASVQARDGQLWVQCPDGSQAPLSAAVLDYNLPGMNGIDLALSLRRLHHPLRMVMITAAMQEITESRAQDLQGVTLLSKPFHLETLENALFGA